MSPVQPNPQEQREHAEPTEGHNPMPWVVVLTTLALFIFGVVYIMRSGITAPPSWGDGRTAAELQGQPATAAAGGADGAAIYAARCAACHQAAGTGLPGVFPPLAGSEWVQGKPETLAAIVLHGVSGAITVKGQTYAGAMPAFGAQLGDDEIAAVLSHLRSQWGNQAAPVTAETVTAVRKQTEARTTPFQGEAELKALP